MSISNVTSASLRGLIALVEKRDRLEAELAQINKQLSAAFSGGAAVQAAPAVKRGGRKKGGKGRQAKKVSAPVKAVAAVSKVKAKAAKPGKRAKSGKRGALKEAILSALAAAGSAGVAVKDLSKKLGVKNQNLHVWFSSTGKSIKGLKKTGAGKWALVS